MSYTIEEVRVLVEEYEAFRELKHKSWILVRLLDLEASVRRLPATLRAPLVLHGMLGLPLRAVAEELNASKSTVARRYLNAIERLVEEMSGNT